MDFKYEGGFRYLCDEHITKLMNSDKPIWISRIGGYDFDMYKFLWDECSNATSVDIENGQFKYLSYYNCLGPGYFDFNDSLDTLIESSKIYINSVRNSDAITTGGPITWEFLENRFIYTNFYRECFNLNENENNKYLGMPFGVIESGFAPEEGLIGGNAFLNSFKNWGNNKKILLISSFEETLKYQTQPDRINNLLKDYEFPNCEFITYKTPVTMNCGNNSIKSNYFQNVTKDYKNWIELAKKMVDDISKIDFDIAFLSCGGYSMYLGNEIKKMGKKSIYIGGMLNVYFNIYGRRYDREYYNNSQNADYRTKIIDDFDDLLSNESLYPESEGLKAYF